MPRMHTVHMGVISHNGTALKTCAKPNRHELLFELNNWFFDYFYANQLPIRSIPPLDDWTRSTEHMNIWTVHFPTPEWTIQIESEPMVFG